jgi:hypothetical protein
MSKKLKVRSLKLKKLPYGKYTWMIAIEQEDYWTRISEANGLKIAPIRRTLENAGTGLWRFTYKLNYRKNRVYQKIYLTNPMDVAMIKLCTAELIRKIYKIELCDDSHL